MSSATEGHFVGNQVWIWDLLQAQWQEGRSAGGWQRWEAGHAARQASARMPAAAHALLCSSLCMPHSPLHSAPSSTAPYTVGDVAGQLPAHRLVPKVGSFTGSRIISLLLAMTCGWADAKKERTMNAGWAHMQLSGMTCGHKADGVGKPQDWVGACQAAAQQVHQQRHASSSSLAAAVLGQQHSSPGAAEQAQPTLGSRGGLGANVPSPAKHNRIQPSTDFESLCIAQQSGVYSPTKAHH